MATRQYDDRNKGTFNKNEKRRPDRNDPETGKLIQDPHYSGTLDVDGAKYFLSGWRKRGEDKSGKPYDFISLACKPATQ